MNAKNTMRWMRFSLIALTLALFPSCGKNSSADNNSSVSIPSTPAVPAPVTRIVSFAPSITEILYALELGDKVCGVTRFCNYPHEAAQKEKIGGYADRNYEAIIRLKPDLAVILKEQRDMIAFFDKYSIRHVAVGSDSVDEIIESIRLVADACSVADRGGIIVRELRKRMEPEPAGGVDRKKVKALLCVSRDGVGGGTIGKCFVAGAGSFYDQLIEAAGGINVMGEVKQAYPTITAEAVIRLAPDVIIELSMSYNDNRRRQNVCDDWKSLKNVPAVKNNRVYCLSGDYLTIPGPRIGLILEDFKNVMHPR